ncbi:MAG: DNA mismatch repair endonuclease MutL [Paludibacteraceae bacterium]|nr:DNA mismatch repair endonuclease MutL [Paludibacteraceae bacterium]MBQ5774604.1 DNA mismatch repair endonuclease MutL [Paludibacteraceae bacterium]
MSDIIHLLPDSVANQIAAGEVIQRPASCLKELVENSLDAGASHIRVIVRDAGRTLLQVVDDGKGMSSTDARMAFERHATSKISIASDLFQLRTMGFRGEALASISAVAHVEMQTRREEDEVGTRIEIAGSQLLEQDIVQCSVGTNIRVKNLFYNVPARRKFLKTDQTELRNLLTEYNRIVLVNPQVQFTFVSNDEILSELPPCTIKQRIEAVFGHSSKPYTSHLVDISTETELVKISGFIGKPETVGKNSQQYMFVNGRYMRHTYFHKAIMTAYSGLLLPDHSPSYFLYFDIDPDAIDVNIHPTKTEIKFADEQAIFQILLAATKEALGKFNVSPSLDFVSSTQLEFPTVSSGAMPIKAPTMQIDPSYNPFKTHIKRDSAVSNWEDLYTQNHEDLPNIVSSTSAMLFEDNPQITDTTPLLQCGNRYILAPVEQGIVLIHQHRAHAHILFKELCVQLSHSQALTQPLLFPEVIELMEDDWQTLQQLLPDLKGLGFVLEQFSPQAYTISSVPALLGQKNAVDTLLQVIHDVQDTEHSVVEQWQETLALSLANQMAIPQGKPLSDKEMRDLVNRFMNDPSRHLPNGQVILSILNHDDIQKRF